MTSHTRHCSCPHSPDDLWARITTAFSQYGLPFCRDILRVVAGTPNPHTALTAAKRRILAKITPPDKFGHQHSTGVWPRSGHPRVMYQGTTLYLTSWLWLWAEPERKLDHLHGQRLTRLCHDPHCVAPHHHQPAAASPAQPLPPLRAVTEWEAAHPRPQDPRSIKWAESDFMGERCLALHRITVYSRRPKKSYCRECAALLRTWEKARAEAEAQADYAVGIPHRTPNEPNYQTNDVYSPTGNAALDALAAGPTLADLVADGSAYTQFPPETT